MLLLTFQTVPWLEGWRSNSRCERLYMTNCQFPFVIVFLSNAWLLFLFVGDAVAKAHSGIWKDLQVSLWSPVCCIHCRSRHGCSSPPSRRQSTTKSQHGILAGVQRFTGESHGAHFCVSVVTPPLSLFSCVSLVIFWRTAQVIWEIRLFCVGKSVCLVGGSELVFVVNAVNLSVLLWSFKGMVMMCSWTCSELLCWRYSLGMLIKGVAWADSLTCKQFCRIELTSFGTALHECGFIASVLDCSIQLAVCCAELLAQIGFSFIVHRSAPSVD